MVVEAAAAAAAAAATAAAAVEMQHTPLPVEASFPCIEALTVPTIHDRSLTNSRIALSCSPSSGAVHSQNSGRVREQNERAMQAGTGEVVGGTDERGNGREGKGGRGAGEADGGQSLK